MPQTGHSKAQRQVDKKNTLHGIPKKRGSSQLRTNSSAIKSATGPGAEEVSVSMTDEDRQKFARLIETVEASEKEMQAEHLAMISELEAAEGERAEEEASSKKELEEALRSKEAAWQEIKKILVLYPAVQAEADALKEEVGKIEQQRTALEAECAAAEEHMKAQGGDGKLVLRLKAKIAELKGLHERKKREAKKKTDELLSMKRQQQQATNMKHEIEELKRQKTLQQRAHQRRVREHREQLAKHRKLVAKSEKKLRVMKEKETLTEQLDEAFMSGEVSDEGVEKLQIRIRETEEGIQRDIQEIKELTELAEELRVDESSDPELAEMNRELLAAQTAAEREQEEAEKERKKRKIAERAAEEEKRRNRELRMEKSEMVKKIRELENKLRHANKTVQEERMNAMRTPNAKYAGRGSLSPSESPVELRRRASERLEAKRRAEAKSRNGNLTMPVIATSEIAAALEAEASSFEKTVDTTATDTRSIKSSSELLTLTSPGVKPMEISNGAAKRIAKAAALSNSGKKDMQFKLSSSEASGSNKRKTHPTGTPISNAAATAAKLQERRTSSDGGSLVFAMAGAGLGPSGKASAASLAKERFSSESGRAAIGKFVASKRSKAVEFPNDGKQETLAGKADKRQLIFKIGPKKKDDIRKRITGQIGKCTSNDSPSKAIIRDNALSVKCTKKEALRFKKAQMKQKRERQRRQAILQEEHKDRSRDRHGMDVFGKRLTREQIKQKGNAFMQTGQRNSKPLGAFPSSKSAHVAMSIAMGNGGSGERDDEIKICHQFNPAVAKANECEQLLERENFDAALEACQRAQELSQEAWPHPFLTEARIWSKLAQKELQEATLQGGDVGNVGSDASARSLDRLRRAVAASPMDDLTDFQMFSAIEYAGTSSAAQTLGSLRFGDLPGLKSRPLHPLTSVAGAQELQAAIPSIVDELSKIPARLKKYLKRRARNQRKKKRKSKDLIGWLPAGAYSELHDASLLEEGGAWENLGLFSYGVRHKNNCGVLFPKLCGLVETLSRIRSCSIGHVIISRLKPGSKIQPHVGAPNSRVTIQCVLELPNSGNSMSVKRSHNDDSAARLIVGNSTVDEIDDASTTPAWRTVLIAHAWHPEVRAKEMLASVALSANMDPSSRESVLKHVYAESAAEWRQEALQLREKVRSREFYSHANSRTRSDRNDML
eukprot:g5328.t1